MDLTVRACRICLNTEVKMFFINDVIENDIKIILGNNEPSKMLLFKYICYECVFLLAKFVKFRKKYIAAQFILKNMKKTSEEITEQDIKQISRHKLKSDLCYHKLPPISLTEEVYVTLEMTVDEETSPFEVKPIVDIKPDIEEVKIDIVEVKPDVVDVTADIMTSGDHWDDDDNVPLMNPLVVNTNSNGCEKEKPAKKKYVRKKKTKPNLPKAESNKIIKQPTEDDSSKDFTVIHLSLSEQLAELEKRKETCNYKDALFKCEFCYKGFLLEETYRNHVIKHDASSGDKICPVCKFRFTKQYLLTQHAAKHATKYACNRCDVITMARDQIRKHLQWHDGVLYKCQYCDEVLTKKTSYLSHVRIKHPSQFVCEQCGYSYISALGLKQHKSKMHKRIQTDKEDAKDKPEKQEESNMYCKECDVTFMSEEAWKRHTVTSVKHRQQLGTACRDCGSCFPSAASLRAHARQHARARRLARRRVAAQRTPRRAGYPRRCEHCPEILTTRMRHWKHYQRCHKDKKYPLGEKKFICEYCGKKFQSNCLLRSHLRARCAARAVTAPLLCAHCRRHYPTRVELQQHILKTHTDVRSFPCKYCGKVFWRATNVSQHAVRCKAARKKAAT